MVLRRAFSALSILLISGFLVACSSSSKPTPAQVLRSFLTAWRNHDGQAMAALLAVPDPDLLSQIGSATAALHATAVDRSAGTPFRVGDIATSTLTSTYHLPAVGAWQVTSKLTLKRLAGNWRISWEPSAIYPSMPAGGRLTLTYEWAPRAGIVGAGGTALTSDQPQVVVGIEGSRVKNQAQLTKVLEAAGATPTEVSAALAEASAHPDYFSAVFTMAEAAYDAQGGNSSQLYTVPGTVFQHVTQRSAATPGLADDLVGSVGPPTAQELSKLGAAYTATTPVGQVGLEQAYQSQLAGTPGATVAVEDAAGHTVATATVSQPAAGTPVTTSIDLTVQQAAEATLSWASTSKKLSTRDGIAALVAVRVSTGQVLAAADLPSGPGFDYALDGEFPPGSTFKILTSTALLDAGLSPASPASCPPTATVDGEVFHNAEGDSPVTDLAQAFTESCNTAFVQLASSHLQPSSFTGVASLYGLGAKIQMGLPAFAGSVPEPTDTADLAATAIGQGRVVVSPLDMAEVGAAVGSGTYHPARLVAGAPADTAAGNLIPPAAVTSLRQMMASVVASGTAAGTGLPAGTYAKTGTAEYGTGNPLPIDAWLVGYDGDIAFAMVQHDSKVDGGPADGPVVAHFLDSLPASEIGGS